MLARVLKATETVGIDRSANFIEEADSSNHSAGISFINHDVTGVPFPAAPADVIFARYILLHLENPTKAIEKWLTQIRPGGYLLLEELEQIDTDDALFAQYIELLKRSLELQNKRMFIGPLISSLSFPNAEFRLNRVKEIIVPPKDTATLFFMNMLTLKDSEYVRSLYSNQEIEDFMANLKQVMESKETSLRPGIWKHRQLAIQKFD